MKKLILVFIIISLISCKIDKQPIENDTISLTPFEWLEGKWQRVNNKNGLKTYEFWEQDLSQDELIFTGIGFTLKEKDTVFKENLKILFKDKHWSLIISGVNDSPTEFKIQEFSKNSFTAINKSNEFPTHIYYSIENEMLKAKVSNDSTEIVFDFIRL